MPVIDTVVSTDTTTTSGLLLAMDNATTTILSSGSVVALNEAIDGSGNLGNSVDVQGYVSISYVWLGGYANLFVGATGTLVGHNNLTAPANIILGHNSADNLDYGGNTLFNQGTIRGSSAAVEVFGDANRIINSGTISAGDDAVYTSFDINGTSGSHIDNSGTIRSHNFRAVFLDSDFDSVLNSGSIVSDRYIALEMNRSNQHVENNGLIQGEIGGISAWALLANITNNGDIIAIGSVGSLKPPSFAVYFGSGSLGFLTNTGTIQGGAAGVQSDFGTTLVITNAGTISGVLVGISFDVVGGATGSAISNSGTISGTTASLELADGNDKVVNTGVLTGYVYLGAGDDILDTRHGEIYGALLDPNGDGVGTVYGGDGSDTYLIGDATINLVEDVGVVGDIDSVKTTVSYQLETNFENLTLLGSRAISGTGNASGNTMIGNSGDNFLTGLAGNDVIRGNVGDDRLVGGAGYDGLYGGDGDDRLNGGAFLDVLFGGDGNDTFVFTAANNTGRVEATADVIFDFRQGDDLIDLGRIDAIRGNGGVNDAFMFIGTSAFNGVAGELHQIASSSGTNTLIEFDLNGDSIADGVIKLRGLFSLEAQDFVL